METNRRGFFGMMAALMGSSIYTVAGEQETPQKAEPTVIFQTITKEVYAPDIQRSIEIDEDLRLCTHIIVLGDSTAPIFNRPGANSLEVFLYKNHKSEIINIGCPMFPSLYRDVKTGDRDDDKFMLLGDMFGGEISKQEALEETERLKKYSCWHEGWKNINPVFNIIYFRSRPQMKAYSLSTKPLELASNFAG